MQLRELILYTENHGIGIVFTISILLMFYRYFAPFMRESIEAQKEIRKFMLSVNMNLIKGKGLEMTLNLQVQEIRWYLQKRIVQYIIDNNLKLNWNIIVKEIDLKIEEKRHTLYMELSDIIEKTVLKVFLTTLAEELAVTKELIVQLLDGLREHGDDDKTLYLTAQRSVETHFEHFENRMHNKIKDLLN